MAELVPGAVVGRYRIEGVLGAGGMGTVYRATQLDTGALLAVKAMHPHTAKRREHRKRFLREARAAMAVAHPNIVQVLEVFDHEGVPLIAMELLSGETLEAALVRDGTVPLPRLARILVRVTSAVGTAHALGIIHRDLKPDNIFLAGNAETTTVKVLDFGIAKLTATQGSAAETAALTATGTLIGTPFYMSPEQAFGEKKIDQRSDVWALGIILYQCLSGVLPTRGNAFGDVFRKVVAEPILPIESRVPGLPTEIAALVGRMLQRTPADRPWDLREVHAVLERFAAETAPSFGVAVEPVWDEWSSDAGSDVNASAQVKALLSPSASAPIAFTPSSLRLNEAPIAVNQLGATLPLEPSPRVVDSPARGAGAEMETPPQAAATSKSRTALVVGLAVIAVGAIALVVLLGR